MAADRNGIPGFESNRQKEATMLTDTVDQVDTLAQDRTPGRAAVERAGRGLFQPQVRVVNDSIQAWRAERATNGVGNLGKMLPVLCVTVMPFVFLLCYKFAIARYAVAGFFILAVTAILALV
jgi:hypothetical protein